VSPRDFWWDERPPPRKLPPPEHGIKVKKFGATWWGLRWITALGGLGRDYAARLGRGRSYARQGRVHDLRVAGGMVLADVTGSRPTPYEVTLRLVPLRDQVWTRAIQAMAAKARFAAALLAGEMPKEIDLAFEAAGTSLFPTSAADLRTTCSCPDWANPCKHVAAVHYVLGDAFDRDPFLLFQLRGRDKERVLDALRQLRSVPGAEGKRRARQRPDHPDTIALAVVTPESYDSLREPVDGFGFHIGEPTASGALLRQLGTPPSWRLATTPHELLQPAVSRAAALARELALGTAPEKTGARARRDSE